MTLEFHVVFFRLNCNPIFVVYSKHLRDGLTLYSIMVINIFRDELVCGISKWVILHEDVELVVAKDDQEKLPLMCMGLGLVIMQLKFNGMTSSHLKVDCNSAP